MTVAAPREPFWNYIDLLLVIGLLFAVVVAMLTGIQVTGIDPIRYALPLQLVLYLAVYLVLRAVFTLRYQRPALQSLGWVASPFRLSSTVILGVVLAFAVAGVAALLNTPKVPSPIEQFLKSPVQLACFCVLAVTLAPFFEELFFRGFLQPLLVRTFGAWIGIGITAGIFGALHSPEYHNAWQYVAAVSAVGFALGWVRLRAGSIVTSTIMHGAYNAVFVAALLISKFYSDK